MRLYTYTNSERGKATEKSGNDNIIVTFTVDRHIIGEVELMLHKDIEEFGDEEDEWVLYYTPAGSEEGTIIAQGHTQPKAR